MFVFHYQQKLRWKDDASANSRYSRPRANSRKAALRPGPRYFAVVFIQACLNCLLTCLTRRTQLSLWRTKLCSDLDNILLHPMKLDLHYICIFLSLQVSSWLILRFVYSGVVEFPARILILFCRYYLIIPIEEYTEYIWCQVINDTLVKWKEMCIKYTT